MTTKPRRQGDILGHFGRPFGRFLLKKHLVTLPAGVLGTVLQILAVACLLVPKTMLVSASLMAAPFVYLPVTFVLEFCLVILMNKILFGSRKDLSFTLA
jgi:hypothetical protein